MANRYYPEFDFYRKILDIISTNRTSEQKIRAIKCSVNQQFEEFNKLLKSHRVTISIEGENYYG